MIKGNQSIFVTTSFQGIHCYPDAPDQVEYLKYPHRHVFNIKVQIDVFHNDREVEFHVFKSFIQSIIMDGDYNYKSCEMISDDIAKEISQNFSERKLTIIVDEDGENGSITEYTI